MCTCTLWIVSLSKMAMPRNRLALNYPQGNLFRPRTLENDFEAPTVCPIALYTICFLNFLASFGSKHYILDIFQQPNAANFGKEDPLVMVVTDMSNWLSVMFNWKPVNSANFEKKRLGFGGYAKVWDQCSRFLPESKKNHNSPNFNPNFLNSITFRGWDIPEKDTI